MKAKNLIFVGIVVVLCVAIVWYLKPKPPQSNVPSKEQNVSSIKLVSPQEFAQLSKNVNAYILDVHTPEQTHIPGTTEFIPYDQIQKNIDKLPTDKSTPILVYCRSGNMSSQAAESLSNLGYTNIYDLAGGSDAYRENYVGIYMTPLSKELGTVIYGDVARTTYTLTNYTPLPVKITKVSTSCGCTKASVEKDELGAYESTVVNVSFDPAVHKDDTDLGDLTRTIYIETDNPNFKNLQSMFSATVIKKN